MITNEEIYKSLNKRIDELVENTCLLTADITPRNSLGNLKVFREFLVDKDKESIILKYIDQVESVSELIEALELLERLEKNNKDDAFDFFKYLIDNMLKGYFDLSMERGLI